MMDQTLPPFLLETESMELECLPLQVSLLTMELASVRHRLAALETASESGPPGRDRAGAGTG